MPTSEKKGSESVIQHKLQEKSPLGRKQRRTLLKHSKDGSLVNSTIGCTSLDPRWLWPHSFNLLLKAHSQLPPHHSLFIQSLQQRPSPHARQCRPPVPAFPNHHILQAHGLRPHHNSSSPPFGFDLVGSSTGEKVARYPVDAMTMATGGRKSSCAGKWALS